MAQLDRAALKAFFETGDKPTQAQFADFIDSNLNLVEDYPILPAIITISSPDILDLFTTPKIIIPAPGTNKVIYVSGLVDFLDFNTIAYTVPAFSKLEFHYTNLAGKDVAANTGTFIDSVADAIERPKFSTVESDITVNAPIVAQYTVGNPTLGNSIIKVFAFYQIIDLS